MLTIEWWRNNKCVCCSIDEKQQQQQQQQKKTTRILNEKKIKNSNVRMSRQNKICRVELKEWPMRHTKAHWICSKVIFVFDYRHSICIWKAFDMYLEYVFEWIASNLRLLSNIKLVIYFVSSYNWISFSMAFCCLFSFFVVLIIVSFLKIIWKFVYLQTFLLYWIYSQHSSVSKQLKCTCKVWTRTKKKKKE